MVSLSLKHVAMVLRPVTLQPVLPPVMPMGLSTSHLSLFIEMGPFGPTHLRLKQYLVHLRVTLIITKFAV